MIYSKMALLSILHIQQFDNSDKAADFYSNTFKEHYNTHHKDIAIPHKHDFYVSILFTNGWGKHEVDFHAYPIKPGAVFLLKPGQIHHWELSEDIDGYIFFHSKSFFDLNYTNRSVNDFPFYYSSQNPPLLQLKKTQLNTIFGYFKNINEEYSRNRLLKQQKIISLTDLLYTDLSRIYLDSEPKYTEPYKNTERVKQLEQLIDTRYKEIKLASEYADMMHLSSKHLNRIVRKTLNKTTSDLITERIILEAQRLLIHSKGSLSDISFELGYEDYAYFSRFFKKKTGYTPSQFIDLYN